MLIIRGNEDSHSYIFNSICSSTIGWIIVPSGCMWFRGQCLSGIEMTKVMLLYLIFIERFKAETKEISL